VGSFGTNFPLVPEEHRTLAPDGGAGETIVPQSQYRNFPYGGFLMKYTFGERFELGGEVFVHGREGFATPQTEASTMIDLGGEYHLKHHEGSSFCFATATLLPARRKITPTSACTGHGKKTRRIRTRTTLVTSADARNGIPVTRSLKRDFAGTCSEADQKWKLRHAVFGL